MTFYLQPADGVICTNLYQSFAECRLKYLTTLRLSRSSNGCMEITTKDESLSWLSHADCLIEGTAKDRVSHFALRSLSLLYPPLHSYVIQKEQLLFRKRLASMSYDDLVVSIKTIMKQLRLYRNFKDGHEQYFKETDRILGNILTKRFLSHFVHNIRVDNNNVCSYHQESAVFPVPFNHVLSLVAKRDIELRNGQAFLRCDQIPTYLSILFTKLLEYSSQKMRQSSCLEKIEWDPRFQGFLPLLKEIYNKAVPVPTLPEGPTKLTLDKLDEISNLFPPCMKALHRTLRARHRLCHRPRVQYTLFLKDVGLPVEHCLQLIQTEYSKPPAQTDPNQKHNCEHSWERDYRRYIYGTRHLYGLEGARKEYSSHSCHKIQKDSPGPNECGGCPFVHYDQNHLKTFLTDDLDGAENSKLFIDHVRSEKIMPIESCHFHLRFKSKHVILKNADAEYSSQKLKALENSQVKIHNVFKPKDYFALMSDFKVVE